MRSGDPAGDSGRRKRALDLPPGKRHAFHDHVPVVVHALEPQHVGPLHIWHLGDHVGAGKVNVVVETADDSQLLMGAHIDSFPCGPRCGSVADVQGVHQSDHEVDPAVAASGLEAARKVGSKMLGRGSGCFGASKVGLLHGGLWYWQRQQLGCSLGQGCRANMGVFEDLSHLSQS